MYPNRGGRGGALLIYIMYPLEMEEEKEKLAVKEGDGASWWKDVYIFAEAAIGDTLINQIF